MAVFTQLSTNDIKKFLSQYALGEFVSAEGIAEGVENTNYLIKVISPLPLREGVRGRGGAAYSGIVFGAKNTPHPNPSAVALRAMADTPPHLSAEALAKAEGGREKQYILTLFESRTNPHDLPFFMNLTEWLADRSIPCPRPVKGKDGNVIYMLKSKLAAVIEFLEGRNNPDITPAHLTQMGKLAARMHLAAEGFLQARRNALSIDGWQDLFSQFRARADEIYPGFAVDLEKELAFLDAHWPHGLPRGIVHADLFPDNVFFSPSPLEGEGWGGGYNHANSRNTPPPNLPPQGGKEIYISGVIDFYFACNDFWIYDLAVVMNAWCFDASHHFVPERARALFDAYHRLRPITDAERKAMPLLARAAAVRFIATRAYDWLYRPEDAMVMPKDPMEYILKLRFHQNVKDCRGYGL